MAFLRSLQFRISWIYMVISFVTIGTYVEMYVDRLKVLSTMLARSPQTIKTLSSPTKEVKEEVEQMINNVLLSDSYIKSVVIIGKDGYVLSNEKELNMRRSSDMMNEPWYIAAINSTNPELTSARMQKFSMDSNLDESGN